MYEIVYGEKYVATKSLTVVQVASCIRAEIKALVKSGTLPLGTYSVRSIRNTIDISAKGLPFPILASNSFEWAGGYAVQKRGMYLNAAGEQVFYDRHTPEACEVHKMLKGIATPYNYDGSEIQSDYFNVRFYLSVTVDEHPGEYDAMTAALKPGDRP